MLPNPMRDPRLQEILERSASDPVFRQRLLTEPHRAVRETFGIVIPESFRIRFIEKGPHDDALIVLPSAAWPARPAHAGDGDGGGELDDSSLESVAGGWGSSDGDWVGQGDGCWDPGTDGEEWTTWR